MLSEVVEACPTLLPASSHYEEMTEQEASPRWTMRNFSLDGITGNLQPEQGSTGDMSQHIITDEQ
jgi:hypothetical protein